MDLTFVLLNKTAFDTLFSSLLRTYVCVLFDVISVRKLSCRLLVYWECLWYSSHSIPTIVLPLRSWSAEYC